MNGDETGPYEHSEYCLNSSHYGESGIEGISAYPGVTAVVILNQIY